jgi:heptosyltransferase I
MDARAELSLPSVRSAADWGGVPRDDFKNILIVRLSSIGDVVFALPALEHLRAAFPKARLSWVVEDRSASILEGHPSLDELVVMPRKKWKRMRQEGASRLSVFREIRRFGRSLRERRFDLSIDFQGNLKSGAVTFAAGAPLRLGLGRDQCKEPNWLFTNRRLSLGDRVVHRLERDLLMLTLIDLPYSFRWPEPNWSAADRTIVDDFLAALPAGHGPVVLLNPGTSAWGPHKRWPPEYYAALGDALVRARDAVVVLSWGPGEEALVDEVKKTMRETSLLAPALPNMRQVGYLTRRAALVVGSDTGPTHLAAVQRTPCVTLFGPYDPRMYYPYQHGERARFYPIGCAPCRNRGCRTRDCMTNIGPGEVYDVCLAALDGRPLGEGSLTPNKTVRV